MLCFFQDFNIDPELQIKQLIDDVCGEVYPKIEAFIVDSKVAILEYVRTSSLQVQHYL